MPELPDVPLVPDEPDVPELPDVPEEPDTPPHVISNEGGVAEPALKALLKEFDVDALFFITTIKLFPYDHVGKLTTNWTIEDISDVSYVLPDVHDDKLFHETGLVNVKALASAALEGETALAELSM